MSGNHSTRWFARGSALAIAVLISIQAYRFWQTVLWEQKLLDALDTDRIETLDRAIEAGVDFRSRVGTVLLMNAILRRRSLALLRLIEAGAPATSEVLLTAVLAESPESLGPLLIAGADPNDGVDGDPPLFIATRNGDLGSMEVLLANGARLDLCNRRGRTVLTEAVWSGSAEAGGMQL
jgi:ankyrin repeat protein